MGFLCGFTGNSGQGYIAKSTDKGKTWVKKTQYVSASPWQLDFDGNIGIAVGLNSLIVRSDDGGETWTTLTNLPNMAESLLRINLHDPNNYFVSSKLALWRSQDKGLTWQAMTLPPQNNGEIIFYGNYQMDSKTTGYVHSSLGISKTVDAGLSWNYVLKSSNPYFYGNVFVLEKDVFCFRNNVTKEFWITKDGGITFEKYELPKNPNEEIDIHLHDLWHEFAVNGNYMCCWPANSVNGQTQCLYRIKYK